MAFQAHRTSSHYQGQYFAHCKANGGETAHSVAADYDGTPVLGSIRKIGSRLPPAAELEVLVLYPQLALFIEVLRNYSSYADLPGKKMKNGGFRPANSGPRWSPHM